MFNYGIYLFLFTHLIGNDGKSPIRIGNYNWHCKKPVEKVLEGTLTILKKRTLTRMAEKRSKGVCTSDSSCLLFFVRTFVRTTKRPSLRFAT